MKDRGSADTANRGMNLGKPLAALEWQILMVLTINYRLDSNYGNLAHVVFGMLALVPVNSTLLFSFATPSDTMGCSITFYLPWNLQRQSIPCLLSSTSLIACVTAQIVLLLQMFKTSS